VPTLPYVGNLEGNWLGIGNLKQTDGFERHAFPTLLFRGPGGEHTGPGWCPFTAYLEAMEKAVPGSTAAPRPDPTPHEAFARWPLLTTTEQLTSELGCAYALSGRATEAILTALPRCAAEVATRHPAPGMPAGRRCRPAACGLPAGCLNASKELMRQRLVAGYWYQAALARLGCGSRRRGGKSAFKIPILIQLDTLVPLPERGRRVLGDAAKVRFEITDWVGGVGDPRVCGARWFSSRALFEPSRTPRCRTGEAKYRTWNDLLANDADVDTDVLHAKVTGTYM
jgi:hypothetical protein